MIAYTVLASIPSVCVVCGGGERTATTIPGRPETQLAPCPHCVGWRGHVLPIFNLTHYKESPKP